MTNPEYEATNSDVEKLIASIKIDIDKRKSMPPRGDANSNIERLRVMNDTMKSFSTESVEELIAALEAANALNKHLDLAIRKAEGCSEALRRRAEAAEKRTAELEAAPNGMMQLSNELAEMKRCKLAVKLPDWWANEYMEKCLYYKDVVECIEAHGITVEEAGE